MIEDPKKALFLRQKDILDKFLERGAISQAQYEINLMKTGKYLKGTTSFTGRAYIDVLLVLFN